jgi:hypothetical protein
MATFELDDGMVSRWVEDPMLTSGDGISLREELKRQMPVTLPTGMCAVIQDEDGTLWVRVDNDPEDGEPLNWRAAGDSESGGEWKSAEELPRPFTVLFEGVQD